MAPISDSRVRVRFAPSPTGYLHVGGARTALFNWLFARKHGGTFVLRIEDTDAARNTPQALAAIYDGLRWLGLNWDEGPDVGGNYGPYLQSERKAIYDSYLQKLWDKGLLYDDAGATRFRSPGKEIVLHDEVCGEIRIDRSKEPDMTLRRPDGSYIFHFGNVVDDIAMEITHVIRGEDHVMNTPKHLELFEALGAPPPVYAHTPLFLNQDGSKMSKRDLGAAVGSYVDEGFVPDAVRNYLCLLGWSPKDDREKLPIEEVMRLFDWDHLNRSPSRFDFTKCQWLNSQYLAEMDEAAFCAHCRKWLEHIQTREDVLPDVAAAARTLVPLAGGRLDAALCLMKPKIKHVPEIIDHLRQIFEAAAPLEEAARAKVAGAANAAANLQSLARHLGGIEDWNADSIQAALREAASAAGVKPGALMFPLRLLATGSSHGVDLAPALVLLGKEEVLRRIEKRAALIFA